MRCSAVSGVVLALLLACAADVAAQTPPLGDLARREAERRKTVKSSGKVYTNDNLRRDAPPTVATPAPPPVAPAQGAQPPAPAAGTTRSGAAGTQAQAAAPAEPAPDEAAWRKRITASRDALSRAQIFAEALQSRINGLSTDFAARDDPAQRAVIAGDRQKALAELDRVKQEILQHQKAITDIQEEARRAGVPPGWVR